MRMLQRGGRLDLDYKAIGAEHGSELGLEDLHRDLAIVPEVLGEVDRGHPARAKLTLDSVPVGNGVRQAARIIAQRPFPSPPRCA